MASTNFVNGTVVQADWLNDVDDVVYRKSQEWISVNDFGAVGDGVADDYASLVTAIDETPIGGKLFVIGLVRITQKLTITKRISIICPSFKDAIVLDVGAANDGIHIKGDAAGLNGVELELNVYGGAGCCLNAVNLERVDRSRIYLNVRAGAAGYGVRLLGSLCNNIKIDQTVNYSPPISSPGMALDHVYVGTDTQGLSVYTNANDIDVLLEGARHGIVSADLDSQGDNWIHGTIEGLSGKPYDITNTYAMKISNLHLEVNGAAAVLTNCKNTVLDCVSDPTGTLNLVGCRATNFSSYTGSINADANTIATKYGSLYINSGNAITDLSGSGEIISSAAKSDSSVVLDGLIGRSPLENLFPNPFMDLWSGGSSAAPDSVTLNNCTVVKDTSIYYASNPGRASASFTVTGTAITDGPIFNLPAPWNNKSVDRWISVMIPIYVPAGQQNVRVYVFAGGQYNWIGSDVTARDSWVVVRGSVKAPVDANDVSIQPRIYNGTAFVTGSFKVGGLSICEGAAAPSLLCDHGKRSEYIVSSVSNPPAFVGQRALVAGKWYMAIGTASSSDWAILN